MAPSASCRHCGGIGHRFYGDVDAHRDRRGSCAPRCGRTGGRGQLIVVLKDGARTPASALASRYQGNVKHTYSTALNGFSVTGMSERQARRLLTTRCEFVERNTCRHDPGDPVEPDLGPGPDRPAEPAARPEVHVPEHRVERDRVRLDTGIRTRTPIRGPRCRRLRLHRQRRGRTGLPGPRHACRRHGRGQDLRRREEGQAGRRPRARLRRQRRVGRLIRGIDWVTSNAHEARRGGHEPRRQRHRTPLENAVRRSITAGSPTCWPAATRRRTPATSPRPARRRRSRSAPGPRGQAVDLRRRARRTTALPRHLGAGLRHLRASTERHRHPVDGRHVDGLPARRRGAAAL